MHFKSCFRTPCRQTNGVFRWFFNDEEVTKVDDMESFFESCASDSKALSSSNFDLSDNAIKSFGKKPDDRKGKSSKGKMRMTSTARKKV